MPPAQEACPPGTTQIAVIIVTNLGSNVKEYNDWHNQYESGDEEARARLPRKCPECGGKMHGHGSYPRKIGVKIRRLRCPGCRRTHAVLPSFLAPYRPCLMALVDRAFRLRLEGRSWLGVADAVLEVSLPTLQRWVRRIRDLAETAVAILSRDARRLDPQLDLDTLLRPFGGDKLKLLDAAICAFWLACQRPSPGAVFPAGKALEFANVHLINAQPTGLWF